MGFHRILSKVLLPAITAVVAMSAAASADTVEYVDIVPLSTTNWDDSVTIPLFDPSLGDLISVS